MNKMNLIGIDFVEFACGGNPAMGAQLESLFVNFGFSKVAQLADKRVEYFQQNDIHFFLNHEAQGFSAEFARAHGPSICSMGWRFAEPHKAWELAVQRGAKPAVGEYKDSFGKNVPAIYGIGESLIYFVTDHTHHNNYSELQFVNLSSPIRVSDKGFLSIDHLTNNVFKGTMSTWAEFYKNIFDFTEVRYFDIRGSKTGLKSYALKSPCGTFCIPINEGTEKSSQINEYLEEYKGPGVQHLAFLTKDILTSIKGLAHGKIEMLDMDEDYYSELFQKFPQVKESHEDIQKLNVLVDGDEEGYLLQIFTKNLIGPIFIEIIQRENHYSFGEGNFGALFRSIERDQMRRGVLA